MSEPTSVTKLLTAIETGDASAWDALFSTVYAELRRLAAGRMRRESGQHTFEPMVLVHEAYLQLLGEKEPHWRNRADFFATAEAMRRILVEHAQIADLVRTLRGQEADLVTPLKRAIHDANMADHAAI